MVNDKTLTKVFHGTDVRIVDDDPVTVVLKDVAQALGYLQPSDLGRHIKSKYKAKHEVLTPGGRQEMTCVTRPGLTQALATLQPRDDAKRAAVEDFQDWMYEDVMESIYETGSYHAGDGAPADGDLTTLDAVEGMVQALREQEKRLNDVEEKQQTTAERLDDVEQSLEEHRAAPDSPTTRFGHEVQDHTWDGMRQAINDRVVKHQQRFGGGYSQIYRSLYRACEREFGFNPLRVQRHQGGQSGIKALGFDQMRALLEMSRWHLRHAVQP